MRPRHQSIFSIIASLDRWAAFDLQGAFVEDRVPQQLSKCAMLPTMRVRGISATPARTGKFGINTVTTDVGAFFLKKRQNLTILAERQQIGLPSDFSGRMRFVDLCSCQLPSR